MAAYILIDGDTWTGIYAYDKLVYEGHSISPSMLLILLNHQKIDYFGRYKASPDWLESITGMPEKLADVKISYMGEDLPFFDYLEKRDNE
jgi:hypothetical protein